MMQAEYDIIVRDLQKLLRATQYQTFLQLHPGLQQALNDMLGYTQVPGITAGALIRKRRDMLENLKDIAQNMTNRIFCGQHHIFYIRVLNVTDNSGNYLENAQHLSPRETAHSTVEYFIQDDCVYAVDIKNLCSTATPDLYLYQHDIARWATPRLAPVHEGMPQNPFRLWAPPPMPAGQRDAMPVGIRLDVVSLHHGWHSHDYELREESGALVLKMQFRVQSVHGTSSLNGQRGMSLLLARLEGVC